ncbi:hypothetical protein [Streptomyces sp. YIM 98790]|uniref:hypothetical protein n=1 Tax=Streptomyces sp. YIM 98790 TaxID=2689077 RepID=UPI00140B48CA|nr:hypothetical protein [Streptomyces sp. YIM 98790]
MTDGGRVQETRQAARDQATAAAGRAGQAADEVAATASQQAGAVAGETRRQAGEAAQDLRKRVADEGRGQVERLAGTVRQWADDLDGMARNAPDDSPARTLAAQAAEGGHRAAEYLDRNGVQGLIGDLQDFARRRPGAFLGGALVAGLVVGRMAKAGKAAAGNGQPDGSRQPAAESRTEGPALGPGQGQGSSLAAQGYGTEV